MKLADELREKAEVFKKASLARFKEDVTKRARSAIEVAQSNYIMINGNTLPRGIARQAAIDWLKDEGFDVTIDRDGDVTIKW